MKMFPMIFLFLSVFVSAQPNTYPQNGLGLYDLAESGMDGIDIVGGSGEGTDNYRFAFSWMFYRTYIASGRWSLSGSLTANISSFDGRLSHTRQRVELRDVGLTPTWVLWSNAYENRLFQPFIEFGIGLHYLNEKDLPTKHLSTNFQFGDHLGFGTRFGPDHRYKLTYQFQHLSNGGIDTPNPGINFHLVSLGFQLKP